MTQANVVEQNTEVEEAAAVTGPTYATYADIHITGGVDSTAEEIRANTCPDCFTIFPATGICGVC